MSNVIKNKLKKAEISIAPLVALGSLTLTVILAVFSSQNIIDKKYIFGGSAENNLQHPPAIYSEIGLGDALQRFYSKNAIFVDVRSREFYNYGHIQDSISIPLEDIKSLHADTINSLKKSESLVLYCNGMSCESAVAGARMLNEMGINNIEIYSAGWPEWRASRLPIMMSERMKLDVKNETE